MTFGLRKVMFRNQRTIKAIFPCIIIRFASSTINERNDDAIALFMKA